MPRKKKQHEAAIVDDGRGNARIVEGLEVLDPTPLAIPTRLSRPQTLAERVAMMLNNERLRAALAAEDMETFEEADDFDVGDDYDPTSPWENDFDVPIDEARRFIAQKEEFIRQRQAELNPAAPAADPEPVVGGGGKSEEPKA